MEEKRLGCFFKLNGEGGNPLKEIMDSQKVILQTGFISLNGSWNLKQTRTDYYLRYIRKN